MVSRVQPVAHGATLAARGDLAWATPLGDAQDLLPSQRWFAGGFNTMRGSARRGLGPADDGADPIGGELRILTGAELRVPIRGIFGLSLFTDAGQVWRDPSTADWNSLAVAVGGGLLLYTPIGPVHIELARNAGRLPIDGNHYQIQLGIGHPY
jgi:translocation and assembly module TamA